MRVSTQTPEALAIQIGGESTDVIVYAGGMWPGNDLELCSTVRENPYRRENVLLLLTTFGGLADTSYRIARCLQEVYSSGEFITFVDTFCKSAGTLLALGADRLIMSHDAELGPLDVQLKKPDEVEERVSGLATTQALNTLRLEVYDTFEHFFLAFRRKTGITSKIAAEVATELTVGIFSPIYSQLEPMRLGETQRSLLVADDYGKRLIERTTNADQQTLDRLMSQYQSHEFIIDCTEAKELFNEVDCPTAQQDLLAKMLRRESIRANSEQALPPIIKLLNPHHPQATNDEDASSNNSDDRRLSGDSQATNGANASIASQDASTA